MAELFGLIRDALRPRPGAARRLAGVRAGGRDQVRRPRAHRRTAARYLALILDGMRATDRGELPGPPPGWQELSERWNASQAS